MFVWQATLEERGNVSSEAIGMHVTVHYKDLGSLAQGSSLVAKPTACAAVT